MTKLDLGWISSSTWGLSFVAREMLHLTRNPAIMSATCLVGSRNYFDESVDGGLTF